MTWVALLLIGVAVSDLVRSVRAVPIVPECLGAAAAVVTGLLVGLSSTPEVIALVVVAALVLAWGQTVTRAFAGRRPWVPLVVLGAGLALTLLASGWSGLEGPAGGAVGSWLDHTRVPALRDVSAERAILVLGAFLTQLSTGNVLVRLVLETTDTVNPTVPGTELGTEQELRGGRLLGPMERVFILGLGLAGEWTAASIVVAAKGLLRWPELQSRRDQGKIHQLTEYFLVGSFVSWLVALGSLALLAR